MLVAYADPPYIGQAAKHYRDHPDYAGEVNYLTLFERLAAFDGWLLHASSTSLHQVMDAAEDSGIRDFRIMAWVKPFAAFKRNVPVAYAWEPMLVKPCRKPQVLGRVVMRDWYSAPITMRKGLAGAKPKDLCWWAFEVLGLEPTDKLVDMYPGTGAVTDAWKEWQTAILATTAPSSKKVALVLRGML